MYAAFEPARRSIDAAHETGTRRIADDQIEWSILVALRGHGIQIVSDRGAPGDKVADQRAARTRCGAGGRSATHIGYRGVAAIAIQRQPRTAGNQIASTEDVRMI